MLRKKYLVVGVVVITSFSLSGCLRTRSQIREDAPDSRESGEVYQAPPVSPVQGSHATASAQYDVDELKQEMTRLQGRIEDLERKQKELEKDDQSSQEEDADRKKLEDRLDKIEERLTEMQKHPSASAPTGSQGASKLLDKAKSQFYSGNFEDAAESLSSYLSIPSVKKIEDATFLRAESYFKLKEYKKAILDYSKFPEKFPHSTHLPTALYKIGLSFDALGMRDDAKGFYQELVEKFPKSPEAKKVKIKK